MSNTTIFSTLLPYQQTFFANKKKRKMWISSRQIGKSHTLAGLLVFKALSKQNGLSLCISTGSRAASEIIRKCAMFAEAVKLLSNNSIDYTQSFDSIKFSNGCRVISLPSSDDGSTLRGWTSVCTVLDEAAFIPKLNIQLNAIAPTLTRDPNSELIFATTPAGMNGDFYKLYQNALQDPAWYVQTTTIHDAIQQGLKVDIEALHTLCPDPEVFAQEYECNFLESYCSMVDLNLLETYEELPHDVKTAYLGIDVGSTGDRTAIATILEHNGTFWLDDICILHKKSYEDQLKIFKQIWQQRNYTGGFIDQNGIGSAVAEFASKQISSKLVGYTWTASNKTPAYENLRSKIFDHKFKIKANLLPLVKADFQNVQRIITESGNVKFQAGHNENGHSDITSAIVLGLENAKQNPANFVMPMPWAFRSRF